MNIMGLIIIIMAFIIAILIFALFCMQDGELIVDDSDPDDIKLKLEMTSNFDNIVEGKRKTYILKVKKANKQK